MSNCTSKSSITLSSTITAALVAGAISFGITRSNSETSTIQSLKSKNEKFSAELNASESAVQALQIKLDATFRESIQLKQDLETRQMAESNKDTLEQLEDKIRKQEKVVADVRANLLKLSERTGIIYFGNDPVDPKTNRTESSRPSATDYTQFHTLTQKYEQALSDLNTLRDSKTLQELKSNMIPSPPSF